MKIFDKFKTICNRYNVFFGRVTDLEGFILHKVMLKAYEHHKKTIPFDNFVRSCVANPIEYLFSVSADLEETVDLNKLNNCFNDGSNIHYGCKYKGRWFFISHSAGAYSKRLAPGHFHLRAQTNDGKSYLVSYDRVMPNNIELNVGTIKKSVLDDYIDKFM